MPGILSRTLTDRRREFARSVHVVSDGRFQVRVWDTSAVPRGPLAPDDPSPTFLVVTGLGIGSRAYGAIARALAEHGRVLVMDLPGFDSLPTPQRPLTIPDHAAAVRSVLRELRATSPVLVGHSMGTQIVVETARSEPDQPRRLVLVAPCVVPALRTIPRTLTAFARSSLHERFGAALVAVAGALPTGLPWTFANLPAVVHYPIEEAIEGLGGHVEILCGARDELCPRAWAQELLARSGAEGRVHPVRGASHQLVVDDADAIVAAALRAERGARGERRA